jgi:hypothetical protein
MVLIILLTPQVLRSFVCGTLQPGGKAWLSFECWRDDKEFSSLHFAPLETAQQALEPRLTLFYLSAFDYI